MKSHWHIQESRPNAKKLSPLKKTAVFYCNWHAFSLKLWVFFTWFIAMIKRKKSQFWICHERHVFVSTEIRLYSLLLSFAEFIQLAMAKKPKKPQWMHQLYIFSNFGDIDLVTRVSVPRKVPIAKIWELMPPNTSFMTKLGLKLVIIAKWYIQSKWKHVSSSVMPGYIHTYA